MVGGEVQVSWPVGVGSSDGTEDGLSKYGWPTTVHPQPGGGLKAREFGNGRCYSIGRKGRVGRWLWLEHAFL